jgi:GNAT superfamily N-acetyltransferase
VSAAALEESIRAAGAPALIALCADRLDLDEDDVAAATRRGLLLAAAGGDPSEAIGPGSRAALETAAELQALGIGARLTAELEALAGDRSVPVLAALAGTLAEDPAVALGTLAAVLLTVELA